MRFCVHGNKLCGAIAIAQVFIESGGNIGMNVGSQFMLIDHFNIRGMLVVLL
jgi:hypothetical protein